ncbi:MAG: phosphodiesterase [Rhodobacteraceae bacterium]|nr:phosphodiesterase [Paracoccaceae bacterium]
MTRIIWLSDLHFDPVGPVSGHDPTARLTAAIDYVNAHYGAADFCVLSGDLVNRGDLAAYEALKNQLDRLELPYYPMVGNHSDRNLFFATLPVPKNTARPFVQYGLETRDGRVICLDTLKPGADAGQFCADRFAALEEQLNRAGDAPVYLFIHHPPFALGLPMQDQDQMENGAEFMAFLHDFPNVRHLFVGHVHRPIAGVVGGIPFTTMRSVLYQAPPPDPGWDWSSFIPAVEAPNFGVVDLDHGDVRVQYIQFCDSAFGVSRN